MSSLWMLCAVACFALMGVCVTLAAQYQHNTIEIVFYRSLFGVFFIIALLYVKKQKLRKQKFSNPKTIYQHLATPYWQVHLYRGISGVIAFAFWFYSMSKLPLATAVTFNYTAPLWLTFFSLFGWFGITQKKYAWHLYSTMLLGFIGIVVLLRPTLAPNTLVPAALAISSGFLSAIAYSQVKALGKLNEPESRTVFYFSLTGTILALCFLPWFGMHPPTGKGLLSLLGVGLFATCGQLALTTAYSKGKTLLVANIQYVGIIFTALLGWMIFNQKIDFYAFLGMIIITISSIAASVLSARQ